MKWRGLRGGAGGRQYCRCTGGRAGRGSGSPPLPGHGRTGGARSPWDLLPTWRDPAAEGRSFPGRQSERRLPFARANQRPGNSHLNPVRGSCHCLRVTGRGRVAALRANQRRGSGYGHAVKPMGLRRGARRLPAERLVSAGELLGDRRGNPAAGGCRAPGRAAAVMAKGARARRRGGAEPAAWWGWGRGGLSLQGGGRAARGISAARMLLPGGAGRRGRRDSSPAWCAQLAGKGLGRRGSPCRIQPFKHGAGRGGWAMTAGGRAGHGSGAHLPSLLLGKNMPKARAGGAEEASPESAERKGSGRPRAGGVSSARAWAGGEERVAPGGLPHPPLPPAVRAGWPAGGPGRLRLLGSFGNGLTLTGLELFPCFPVPCRSCPARAGRCRGCQPAARPQARQSLPAIFPVL